MRLSRKRTDFAIVLCLLLLGVGYNLGTDGTLWGKALFGGMALFVPSTIYLGLRRKKPWGKIALAVLIFGLILGFFFEFIQEFNKAYVVESRVFPKILGVVSLDNILGHAMMSLLTFTVYEHFFVAKYSRELNRKWKKMFVIASVMAASTVILYYVWPDAIKMRFSYAIFAGLALLPLLRLVWRRPSTLLTLTAFVPFFMVLYFVAEWFAVKYGWWVYPGDSYLGWVDAFGIRFPFEELLFWMIFYAPAITSYYMQYIEASKPVHKV